MNDRWRVGFQFGLPGPPITAACSGSARRRLRARISAPWATRWPGDAYVVGECCGVSCGDACIDLRADTGDEELVAAGETGCRQCGIGSNRCPTTARSPAAIAASKLATFAVLATRNATSPTARTSTRHPSTRATRRRGQRSLLMIPVRLTHPSGNVPSSARLAQIETGI